MNDANDKVVFRKVDVARLDRMPSNLAPDARVLRVPRRSLFGRLAGWLFALVLLVGVTLGGLYVALANGFLDEMLTARAGAALDKALGPGIDANIGSTRIRLSASTVLALEAGDVKLVDTASGRTFLTADTISLVLDPLAFAGGKIAVSDVRIGNARLDAALFATNAPLDWAKLRIDRVPDIQALVHAGMAKVADRLANSPAARLTLQSLTIDLPKPVGRITSLRLADILFERPDATRLSMAGRIEADGKTARLSVIAQLGAARVDSIAFTASDLPLGLVFIKKSKLIDGPLHGIDAAAELTLTSRIGDETGAGRGLAAGIKIGPGMVYADRIGQELSGAEFRLDYDFAQKSVSVSKSGAKFGPTIIPVEGSIIDLDRVKGWTGPGYALDLLSEGGSVLTEGSGEKPASFNAKASVFFEATGKKVSLSPVSLSSTFGNAALSLGLTFGTGSPEVSFSMRSSDMKSAGVKQFWPFWIAPPARKWVFANLFAGTVSNGEVDVFIPGGVLEEGKIYPLNDKQLNIRFDIAGTRFNFLGDLPPARNASGHFEQKGGLLSVTMPGGEIFLPSGQSVRVSDAALTIKNTFQKPLMADIALKASGDAAAVAELSTFKPIEAVQKTEFAASDFSGPVTGTIAATIGLQPNQNPPKPVWNVAMVLDGVSLKKPISGRKVDKLEGKLDINQTGITLDAKADLDGAAFDIALSQALSDPKGLARKLNLAGTLEGDDVKRFAPSLAEFVSGRMAVKLDADPKGRQTVEIDLGKASISVPWIGWKKGAGIAAKASFKAQTTDGVTKITDFVLKGDGFGAEGSVTNDKNGLVQASLTRVRLTPSDNYQMTIKRAQTGFAIDIRGKVADLRPIIGSIRKSTPASRESSKALSVTLQLDNAIGYNQESMGAVKLKVATADGRINTLSLAAVTKSGQAVVASKSLEEKAIEITAGDAGAVARFADVYRNMSGGLLNIKLRAKDADSWRGSVDIRNFALVNEARLKSIVSTPTGEDGRSLNDAVSKQINAASQGFRRGFARVLVDGPMIRIENGVVRGDEVGAVFQGTVRDADNRMDMTGTFMPAYGLNRLFAELPLIGAILGNGSDRGLLGITFKLVGQVENPKLTVNPLSLIAPGVFRNIFEFE